MIICATEVPCNIVEYIKVEGPCASFAHINISKNHIIEEKILKGDIWIHSDWALNNGTILSCHKNQISFNTHKIHVQLSMYITFKNNVTFAFGCYTLIVKILDA